MADQLSTLDRLRQNKKASEHTEAVLTRLATAMEHSCAWQSTGLKEPTISAPGRRNVTADIAARRIDAIEFVDFAEKIATTEEWSVVLCVVNNMPVSEIARRLWNAKTTAHKHYNRIGKVLNGYSDKLYQMNMNKTRKDRMHQNVLDLAA